MKNRLQNDTQEIIEYMSNWIDTEDWDDMQCMVNAAIVGCPDALEHMADHLIGTGAIDSRYCYEYARTLEQDVELLAKRFSKLSKKRRDLCFDRIFDEVLFISCEDCNHCSFVHDRNEELYPEVMKKCWSCESENIEVNRHAAKNK
jgi:predicted Zn-ribbon and HTH transcriptional regulator